MSGVKKPSVTPGVQVFFLRIFSCSSEKNLCHVPCSLIQGARLATRPKTGNEVVLCNRFTTQNWHWHLINPSILIRQLQVSNRTTLIASLSVCKHFSSLKYGKHLLVKISSNALPPPPPPSCAFLYYIYIYIFCGWVWMGMCCHERCYQE